MGNIDFSTEYIYSPDDIWNEGTYAITTDPGNVHRLAVSFRDHTNSKGYMMVVNGSIKKQTYFWKKFVPVKPDTIYILSGWVAHWSIENPAHLCFYINNNPISEFIVPYGAGEWHNFSFIWNSGGNREALIEICDSNILAPGNDFVLDDLYFSRVFQ
ncbi:MAG: hypothetical protein JXB88_24345 [Spirochaetales bacterium]|nr:hypothetical protein [Spirochaetales bacterium]